MIFNPLNAYVLTIPFIWRGNVSVVQITICMESTLRRLWTFHGSQKAYNVCFFAQVCGPQNRQRRSERQCVN
jgi:hypothetical protein